MHTKVVAPRTIPKDDAWRDDQLVRIPKTKLKAKTLAVKLHKGAREPAVTHLLMVDIHHRASFRVAEREISLSDGGITRQLRAHSSPHSRV